MTVGELAAILLELDEDCEVRIARDPKWSKESHFEQIVNVGDVVYIAEGEPIGYLPHDTAAELGWGNI